MSKIETLIPKKEQLTQITDTTLVDLLIVARSLPAVEIAQLEAFTGNEFNVEDLAVQIHTSGGMKWTGRVVETREPIFVAGFFQVGTGIYRSFMLCGDKTFSDLYAGETTRHVAGVMQDVADSDPYIRIETICLAERDLVRSWYPKIGLAYESTMPNYGARGENAVMYTKFGSAVKTVEPTLIERI